MKDMFHLLLEDYDAENNIGGAARSSDAFDFAAEPDSINYVDEEALFGKGAKARTIRVSAETFALFEAIGCTHVEDYVVRNPKRTRSLTRQAIEARMAK